MKKLTVIAVGILFILLGFLTITYMNNKTKYYTVKTEGVIKDIAMDITIEANGKQKAKYYLVVTYKVDGKKISAKSAQNVSNKAIIYNRKKGDKVTIFYNPKEVDRFVVKGNFLQPFIILSIIFIFYGISLIILGIFHKDDLEIIKGIKNNILIPKNRVK